MSLWCGACRKEIFHGFGLLYRMDIVDGKPRPPTKDNEYVPPNSAVCTACWACVPTTEHFFDAELAMYGAKPIVFAYVGATSSNSPVWGSKQWSDIETRDTYVFLRRGTVVQHLPRTLPIIDHDAEDKERAKHDDAREALTARCEVLEAKGVPCSPVYDTNTVKVSIDLLEQLVEKSIRS